MAAPGTVTVDATVYGDLVLGPYRDAGYDIPDLLVDAVPPGGLAAADAAAGGRAGRRRSLDDGRRASTSATGRSRCSTCPATRPGSIGLWEAAAGVLFSGDAVYDGPLLDELDGSDVVAYVATMRRLRELPVHVVHAGHEASFGRARLVELCDAYLAAPRLTRHATRRPRILASMARVAFVGLGAMGAPMAGHLAPAGHQVTVYNRTRSKADRGCASTTTRRRRPRPTPPTGPSS